MTPIHRIGLLTPGWPGQNIPNGIATSVYNLALGLHLIGHTPIILAEQIDGPYGDDVPVVHVPQLKWRLRDRFGAKIGNVNVGHRNIARNIAAATQEAISRHNLGALIMEETNGWASIVRSLVPVPVFVTLHGPWVLHKTLQSKVSAKEDRQREARENRAFATTAGLISPSQNVLEAVEKAAGLPVYLPRIVLPNSLPPDPDPPSCLSDQPRDILFVGRFDKHKGGDVVLEAFARLSETHPEAQLTFVGPDRGLRQADGTIVHIATELAALKPTVRNRIDYKGSLDRAAVAALRRHHPITLIASRYENLNYTLLEAMAAGQAIICTEVGGPAEVLTDEQHALLVPPDDPYAMAEALGRVISDSALAQRLGQSARKHLELTFDPATIARQTVNFIETTLNRSAG